jgi:hypothetical protein
LLPRFNDWPSPLKESSSTTTADVPSTSSSTALRSETYHGIMDSMDEGGSTGKKLGVENTRAKIQEISMTDGNHINIMIRVQY